MPLLLLLLLIGVLSYFWISRRGSTLTRECRWRVSSAGAEETRFACSFCGAKTELPPENRTLT